MATQIDVWQITDTGKFKRISSKLKDGQRDEPNDLEGWIVDNPEIIDDEIKIIGRQITTTTGELDLLAIDSLGNTIIIELKRDKLPREALAQAIDYASDIANWDFEKLNQECLKFNKKSLEDFFYESYPTVESDDISFNSNQRIILLGFSIDESLQRMIEWLFNGFSVGINAIALKYILTEKGDELIAKTSIIPEETEKRISHAKRGFLKSDTPGNYDIDTLKNKLIEYLSLDRFTSIAIKKALLPLCLRHQTVTRELIIDELNNLDLSQNKNIGVLMSNISQQIGTKRNDFLRQIISYETPINPWAKDNYSLKEEYKDLVKGLLTNQ